MQQYYNLNLDDMGVKYSYEHAAALVSQLPRGSRVLKAIDPDTALSDEALLLLQVEFYTHWLMWSKTKDASSGRNKPKPLPLPSETRKEQKRIRSSNKRFVDKILGVNTNG